MGKHILNGRVVIPLLHANPFIITQKIHKFDQVISKVKSDIEGYCFLMISVLP